MGILRLKEGKNQSRDLKVTFLQISHILKINIRVCRSDSNLTTIYHSLSYPRKWPFSFVFFSGRGKNGEAVLHLAYKDGECGEKWGSILNSVSKSLVDQEVHRAIEYKFNMTVPKPLETVYKYWNEGAW